MKAKKFVSFLLVLLLVLQVFVAFPNESVFALEEDIPVEDEQQKEEMEVEDSTEGVDEPLDQTEEPGTDKEETPEKDENLDDESVEEEVEETKPVEEPAEEVEEPAKEVEETTPVEEPAEEVEEPVQEADESNQDNLGEEDNQQEGLIEGSDSENEDVGSKTDEEVKPDEDKLIEIDKNPTLSPSLGAIGTRNLLMKSKLSNVNNEVSIGRLDKEDHPKEHGEIMLFKEAKRTPRTSELQTVNEWDVTLRLEQKIVPEKTDIVIVFDKSGSMKGSRLSDAKKATNDFIDIMLEGGLENYVRIGIVPYSGKGLKRNNANDLVPTNPNTVEVDTGPITNLTNNKQTLNESINSIEADGGTNTQAGIHEAAKMLDNVPDYEKADNQFIIVVTDGLPTMSYRWKEDYHNNPPDNYFDNQKVSLKPEEYLEQYEFPVNETADYNDSNVYGIGRGLYDTSYRYNAKKLSSKNITEFDYSKRLGYGNHYYMLPKGEDYSINNYTKIYSSDKLISYANNAISEANIQKEKYTIGTIAIDVVDPVAVNLISEIASDESYAFSADVSQLDKQLQKLRSKILNGLVSNLSIEDTMAEGIKISDVMIDSSNPNHLGDNVINHKNHKLEWNIPNLNKVEVVDNNDLIYYEELTYRIRLDEDPDNNILSQGINPDNPELFEANKIATVEFVDNTGKSRIEEFPKPKINPILYGYHKKLLDADGNPIESQDSFLTQLIGPMNIGYDSHYEYYEDKNGEWYKKKDFWGNFTWRRWKDDYFLKPRWLITYSREEIVDSYYFEDSTLTDTINPRNIEKEDFVANKTDLYGEGKYDFLETLTEDQNNYFELQGYQLYYKNPETGQFELDGNYQDPAEVLDLIDVKKVSSKQYKYDENGKYLYSYEDVTPETKNSTHRDFYVVVTNKEKPISLDISKIWLDNSGQEIVEPDEDLTATVQLYRKIGEDGELELVKKDDQPVEVVLNKSNEWTVKIENLPKRNSNGEYYIYEAVETSKSDGYELVTKDPYSRTYQVKVNDVGDLGNKLQVVNKDNGIKIAVRKNWQIGEDLVSDALVANFKLMRKVQGDQEGELVKEIQLNSDNGYMVVENVAKTDADGNFYTYYIEEDELDGFEQVEGTTTEIVLSEPSSESEEVTLKDGTTVKVVGVLELTNKLETTSIKISKNWSDDQTEITEITVDILAEGKDEPVKTVTIKDTDDWHKVISDLPAGYINEDGQFVKYEYSVKEHTVKGYRAKYSQDIENNEFEITNQKLFFPATGAFGTTIFTAIGLVIISVGILLYRKKKTLLES